MEGSQFLGKRCTLYCVVLMLAVCINLSRVGASVPLNITSLHDNHVCPSSRARWQDYTVYLETKPRLCMIQITFHARYKREPIYTNTWWSNTVDYVYKVVYDPEVSFVDRIPPQPIRL